MEYKEATKLLNGTKNWYNSLDSAQQNKREKKNSQAKYSPRQLQCWGLAMALLSAFLGSVKGWIVSSLQSVGPLQVFGLRTVGTVTLIIPILLLQGQPVWFDRITNLYLLLRSVLGNIAVAGYYYGASYLPLADASLIFYTTPVYTMVIGYFLLKEKCGVTDMFSLGSCLAGVIMVTFPGMILSSSSGLSTENVKGLVGCFVGAFAQAVVFIILRKLKHVPAAVNSLWWAMIGTISLAITMASGDFHAWSCGWEGFAVVALALCGFTCEIALVIALRWMDAGRASVALSSEILWAFVLQAVLQRTVPSIWSIGGGLCILFSIFVYHLYDTVNHCAFLRKIEARFSIVRSKN